MTERVSFCHFLMLSGHFLMLLDTFLTLLTLLTLPATTLEVSGKVSFHGKDTVERTAEVPHPVVPFHQKLKKVCLFVTFSCFLSSFWSLLVTFGHFCAPLVHFAENSTTGCGVSLFTRGKKSDRK